MRLRVSGAQINVIDNDVSRNFSTISSALDYASAEHADILLTPEGALSGYEFENQPFDFPAVTQAAADLARKAKSLAIGLALGTIYREDDGVCYNQLRFYDKAGGHLGFHSKILRCTYIGSPEPQGELAMCSTAPLRTFQFLGVTVGGLLCNDMWANPYCTPMPDDHLSQQLSRMGAKVIFHAVNGGRDAGGNEDEALIRGFHESNQRFRAAAGRVWIVTVDNSFPETVPNTCTGGIIGPDGKWRLQLPKQGQQFFTADIEI